MNRGDRSHQNRKVGEGNRGEGSRDYGQVLGELFGGKAKILERGQNWRAERSIRAKKRK